MTFRLTIFNNNACVFKLYNPTFVLFLSKFKHNTKNRLEYIIHMKKIDIKQFACTVLLTLGVITGANAQNESSKQVLVGGTDFSPINPTEEKAFIGIDEIKMTGVLGGTLEVYGTQTSDINDIGYDYDSNGNAVASTFHDSELVAITKNPKMLDSLHYIDDKNEDWGIVWSRFKGTTNKTIMTYRVEGLKPNSSVRVIIKYRSVIDPDADGYDKLKCAQNGSQLTSIKVAENPDMYNLTAGQDAPQLKHGESGTYDNGKIMGSSASSRKADAAGSFSLNVNMSVQFIGQNCASIEITSIEIYGTIDPQIYSQEGENICAGEIANLKAKDVFLDAKYQWYDDGKAIAGATSPNYSFETTATGKTSALHLNVTYNGVTFKSNTLTINAEKCCEIINEEGVSATTSRKIVFKEDFGEFDLSDKTGSTYRVWDYSDIANPVQVTKRTTTPFRYELEDAPLGCTFKGKGAIEDGEYTVAGVLTGYEPYKGMDGAKLEWANGLHGINHSTIPFDHSDKPEGCCLLVNCKDQTAGQNIYEREITNLCQNRLLFFECYISIFTHSANGAYNPVDVTVRMTEIGNAANVIEKSATQTLPDEGGTGGWLKLSCQIYLEKGSAVRLEIVNNVNTDQNGNDLTIDDIQLFTCAAPSLQAYFDDDQNKENVTCDGNDISIFAKPTKLLTDYFGSNIRYLYQWTLTPDDKKSWKRLGDPIEELNYKAGENPFAGLIIGDKVYFRVIAGSDYTLSTTEDPDYNADDPCAPYSVSEPIVCKIDCPTCTEPANIKIKSDKKASGKKNKKDVIELCYGESVTLSQVADITPDKSEWASDFKGFAIKWFETEKPGDMLGAKTILNDIVSPKVVEYDDETLGGTEMPVVLYAVDALYLDGTCKTADTIYIRFNPVPDAEFRSPKAEFCEGEGKGLIDMRLTNGNVSDYTIRWWQGADTLATPLGNDIDTTFFETLKATEGGVFSYQLIDNQTGCKGDIHNYEVIVNPIPEKPSDENILYELTVEKEILTTDKFNQTLDSTLSLLWYTNVDPAIESNSKGAKSVEVYLNNPNEENSFVYYIAYKSEEGCFSERAKVDVTVSPITSAESILADENEIVNVYTVSGALIKANVKRSDALRGLTEGVYVVGNDKIIVK